MLFAKKLCFIICNLYYNTWIAYHLKMLHVPPVVRVPQFENCWNGLSLMIILVEGPELKHPEQCGPTWVRSWTSLMQTVFSGAGFWQKDDDKLNWIDNSLLILPVKKHKKQFDIGTNDLMLRWLFSNCLSKAEIIQCLMRSECAM
jgi:hypothetical protein